MHIEEMELVMCPSHMLRQLYFWATFLSVLSRVPYMPSHSTRQCLRCRTLFQVCCSISQAMLITNVERRCAIKHSIGIHSRMHTRQKTRNIVNPECEEECKSVHVRYIQMRQVHLQGDHLSTDYSDKSKSAAV